MRKKKIEKMISFLFAVIIILNISAASLADWKENEKGKWYVDKSGKTLTSQWMQDSKTSKWYYLDENGWAKTGWLLYQDAYWYYFNQDGTMATGWVNDCGYKYYMDENTGIMRTGWVLSDGKWYYMDTSGLMVKGWVQSGYTWYYMDNTGEMVTGLKKIGGYYYYFSKSGAMQTGWVKHDGDWYYFTESGSALTTSLYSGGTTYYFDNTGKMQTGWVEYNGEWIYTNENGYPVNGWKYIDNDWYYFKEGKPHTGWLESGANWYYFNSVGTMVTDSCYIDGVKYEFNESGEWTGKSKAAEVVSKDDIVKPTYTQEEYLTGVNLEAQKKINSDFVAWIQIPGTGVDYPVVSSDNIQYYLDYTFEGVKSSLGTLFSLSKCNWEQPSKNISIYGHDVEGSGKKMFKKLLDYKDYTFYLNNRYIYLDSIYRPGVYEIFAVLDITQGDYDPSKATFASDAEFLSFVNNAKSLSKYDTGVEVKATDTIISLITCDRYFKRRVGRFIVMAVRVQ